jgi:hypothetical protein
MKILIETEEFNTARALSTLTFNTDPKALWKQKYLTTKLDNKEFKFQQAEDQLLAMQKEYTEAS